MECGPRLIGHARLTFEFCAHQLADLPREPLKPLEPDQMTGWRELFTAPAHSRTRSIVMRTRPK